MKSSLNKKGQVELVITGVLALTLASILLVMGLIMMDELMQDVSTDSATVTNETTAAVVTEAGTSATANTGVCGFNSFAVTSANVKNATAAYDIAAGNYTVTASRGVATIAFISTDADDVAKFNNSKWNITGTYLWGNTEACDASNSTIAGQGKFADYWDLIVLAIIITVVISLIIGLGMLRGRRVQ